MNLSGKIFHLFVASGVALLSFSGSSLYSAPQVLKTVNLSNSSSLDHPVPIAVNPSDGSVYVAAYTSGNLIKFNPTTKEILAEVKGHQYPAILEFVNGKVYLVALNSSYQQYIYVYDANLNPIDLIPSQNGLIHSLEVVPSLGRLYYGTYGRFFSVQLAGASQTLLKDFSNGAYSISSINVDAAKSRAYLTGYDVRTAQAEIVNFDLGANNILAQVPIGANPVVYDNRYDSDRDGDKLFITQQYTSSITVVDMAQNKLIKHIGNVSWPQRLALDSGRHRLYVVDNYTDKLHILDTENLTMIKSLIPGDDPSGVTIDSVRNRVYTANVWTQDIGVVNSITNTLIERIPFGAASPYDIKVVEGDENFYVTNGPNGGIFRLDRKSYKVVDKINFYDMVNISGLFDTPSGLMNMFQGELDINSASGSHTGYVLDEFNKGIAVLNLKTRAYQSHITPDGSPSSLALHRGNVLFPYVSNSTLYLGVSNGGPIIPYNLGASDQSQGIAVNPNTNKAYIANYSNHQVVVFDLNQSKVIKSIDVGQFPAYIGVEPNENKIYVSNYGSDTVSVIDGNSDEVTTTLNVGTSPWGVDVNPKTSRIYVVNSDDNSLSVINSRSNKVVATLPIGGGARHSGIDIRQSRVYVANQSSGTITIIEDIVDITPPVIDCHDEIIVKDVETDTVKVDFRTPPVTDNIDPNPTVTVEPASGSQFPAGKTIVVVTATDASANVAVCKFPVIVKQKICPTPIGELNAAAQSGRKIKLDWEPSRTKDLQSYRIYMGTPDIDFSTPQARVKPWQHSWTAEDLTGDVTYKFAVRAVHESGCEDTNTNIVSATAFDVPHCLAASIKSPKNGKKVSGQRLTVTAAPQCNDISSIHAVKFQYRLAGGSENSWQNIPAANKNHPNPDTKFPYFIHWNVSSLNKGEYHLRSIALDSGGSSDPSPSYVTIHVDHIDPDSEEKHDDKGNVEKIERVENHKKNTVVVTVEEMSTPAEVEIPAGALSDTETKVTITLNPKSVPKGKENVKSAGTHIEIELKNGQHQLGGEATLTLPYGDSNNDGIVDGTAIKEDDLTFGYYNPENRKWEKMANSTINKSNKTVSAPTDHFSLFGLFDATSFAASADATFRLGDAYVFPNPVRGKKTPTIHVETGLADSVEINIYDTSGRSIHSVSVNNIPSITSGIYAYRVPWDISGVPSGIYMISVTSKKVGQENLRKVFKTAIIK